MHITQESDYAVRIVYCLARSGVRMDARTISGEMQVTLRFTLKILGKLAQANIVNSYKGNRGGYELARPAKDVSLLDVIVAVEGPYRLSRCIGDNEESCGCSMGDSGCCAFKHVFGRISESINQQLQEVNFAQLLEDKCQKQHTPPSVS